MRRRTRYIVAGILLCSPDTLPANADVFPAVTRFVRKLLDTLFRHIGLFFGERLKTLSTSSDSKVFGFTRPHVIGFVADLFFPLWRADLFFSGFAVEFAGCVWTVPVSGKKKLRIKKYPHTCGRGLGH